MKPDQERVKVLLTETIALLCKNGLNFEKDIRVQGLLGITVDSKDVFIVQLNENLWLGEDDNAPSNDILPSSSPQCAADIAAKSPRRRTGLANRDSPIGATRSVFDEKFSDNSSDAPGSGRAKNRNGKLGDKRHADKSEAIDGASATENIQNNVRSVDIKTERSTSADEDVVFIDDEDTVGDDAQDDGYDFTGTSYDKTRRQSIDEHRLSFDDLNNYERNYARSPASKRLRRSNSSSEKLFGPSSSTTVLTSRDEAAASSISEANTRVKLEIDPDDGPSGSDEQHFQGYDDIYPTYPWDGSDAPSNDYSSALASDILYTFPPNNRSFPSRSTSWFSERKRSSAGQKSLSAGRPIHPGVFSSGTSSSIYGGTASSVFGAGRSTTGGGVGTGFGGGAGFGGNVATRFGFTRYKRFNQKTFVCQYADCGKTFCHSYHLYRHQREKHGCRYDNQTSLLTDAGSVDQSVSLVRQNTSLGLKSENIHRSPMRPVSPLVAAVTASLQGHQSGSMILPGERKLDASICCVQPGCTHVFCSVAGLSCHLKGNPTQSS